MNKSKTIRCLLFCFLFFGVLNTKAQIVIPDSSFEDVDIGTDQFFTWHICSYFPTPWIAGENFGSAFIPTTKSPTNGTYCINIGGGDIPADSFNKILGVKLNSQLITKKNIICIWMPPV